MHLAYFHQSAFCSKGWHSCVCPCSNTSFIYNFSWTWRKGANVWSFYETFSRIDWKGAIYEQTFTRVLPTNGPQKMTQTAYCFENASYISHTFYFNKNIFVKKSFFTNFRMRKIWARNFREKVWLGNCVIWQNHKTQSVLCHSGYCITKRFFPNFQILFFSTFWS